MVTISIAKVSSTINSSYVLIENASFRSRLGNGGIHTLSAPQVSILYCHGAVISRFEIGKQVAFKTEPCRTYPTVAIYPTFFI